MATGCQGVTRSHTHKTLGRVHSSGWQQAGLQHREEAECEERPGLALKQAALTFFLGSTEKIEKENRKWPGENVLEKYFKELLNHFC